MKRAREEFVVLRKAGEGTYGDVHAAWDTHKKCVVAIKNIKSNEYEEGLACTSLREIAILNMASHPNIVALRNTILDSRLAIVLEWCPTNLHDHIKQFPQSRAPPDVVRRFMREIVAAIDYCHRHKIIHRDIKSKNILVTTHGNIKLADFGLTRQMSKTKRAYTPEVITLWYRCPELLLGQSVYDPYAIDMWSIGCVFSELISGHTFARGQSQISQLFEIFKTLGTPAAGVLTKLKHWDTNFPAFKPLQTFSQDVTDRVGEHGHHLLMRMLDYDCETRINARLAKKTLYLRDQTLCHH